MSQENPSFQQMVEHEFVNSNNIAQSLLRLAVEPSAGIVRRLVSKFIGLLVSIMDRILELLGVALTDPDKLYENIDKAKHNAKLLTMIMMYILEDPEIRENIRQVAIALNDSALRPFLAAALITFKEIKPAIDEAEEELIEKIKEGIRRTGDGATDAIENVIAGVPGVGNAWSAISGVASVAQSGQSVVETTLKLILETTYRILELLRKTNVPGLESVDSFIDFGINAYNTYTNVLNKFDAINAAVQQLQFNPKDVMSKEKFVSELKKQDEAAQAMMPANMQTKPTTPMTQPEKPHVPTTQPEKPQVPTTQTPKPPKPAANTGTSIKKGGSRKKYRKYKKKNRKKRTKKRALKH